MFNAKRSGANGHSAPEAKGPIVNTGAKIGPVLLWMCGALLSFSAMAVSIRGLDGTLNVFEILSIRSTFGVLVLGALAVGRPTLRTQLRFGLLHVHLFRNLVHFGAQIAWVTSVTLLPLAMVFAIEFTAPAWAALFAVLFLGERLTASRIGSVALGILGVIIIVRPGTETFQPTVLVVIAAALGFAITFIVTKKLTGIETTFAILFWMNLIQLPLNLAGSDPLFVTKLGIPHLLPAAGVAISGLASHFCLTNAFRRGDALLVVPLDFLRVPLIALVGWLFYQEALDPLLFIGAGLIASGIIWNLWAETARQPQSP